MLSHGIDGHTVTMREGATVEAAGCGPGAPRPGGVAEQVGIRSELLSP